MDRERLRLEDAALLVGLRPGEALILVRRGHVVGAIRFGDSYLVEVEALRHAARSLRRGFYAPSPAGPRRRDAYYAQARRPEVHP